MSSLDYDIDSMSGLMPQILALTAPPGTRDNNRVPQQNNQANTLNQISTNGNGQTKTGEAGLAAHPYFRRPGRGHNHDCCDACSEGGDLICCDSCPASFHLTCHDPPLDEEEIPKGEWACHQCRMGGTEEEKLSTSIGKSSKITKSIKKKEEPKQKDENHRKVYAGGRELEISDTPLYTLIKAAAIVNPTQFTLPYEMTLPANFPGEPKDTFIKKNGSKRLPKKKPYELDNGLVPLPAKLCFQCSKSCRIGPLIPCDFCPLFYHLDCLDPPLTTPPMGRWMCPNHPEHHLDTSLLRSHSLTERVKLWDKFSVPVDQDSVKLNFFQKCHRLNPPFRYKVKKALRSRLRVPGAIKAHYQDPPDLLPHLSPSDLLPYPPPYDELKKLNIPTSKSSSLTTSQTVFPSTPFNEEKDSSTLNIKEENQIEIDEVPHESGESTRKLSDSFVQCSNLRSTKEEKFQWLSSLLSLQTSLSQHLFTDYINNGNNTASEAKKKALQETCNGLDENSKPSSPARPNFLNGDLISHESKALKLCVDGMNNHISHTCEQILPQSSHCLAGSKKSCRKSQKKKLSSGSTYKSQRHRKASSSTDLIVDNLNTLGISLRETIEEKHEVSLNHLEQPLVKILAYERLNEILESSKPKVVLTTPKLAARALLCPLEPDIVLKSILPKQKTYSTDVVPMTYRILNIGKGSHNHANLELYGHCNYISHHHACILFDETTGHYELINYSEYETKVDGVAYHCDVTDKTVSQAVPPSFLQHVKAIIAIRKGSLSRRETSLPQAMTSRPGEKFGRCECRRETTEQSSSSEKLKDSGWEGTAVLHHGSLIKFGCIKFVFSVVEEASKGDWARDTSTTYEKFFKVEEKEREKENEEKDHKCKEEKEVAIFEETTKS